MTEVKNEDDLTAMQTLKKASARRVNFNYVLSTGGDDMLQVATDQHVNVRVLFTSKGNGDPTHVYLDEDEFSVNSDTLYGIFVVIGGNILSVMDVVREAGMDYPHIKREVEQESADAASNERFLSSPCATGRI